MTRLIILIISIMVTLVAMQISANAGSINEYNALSSGKRYFTQGTLLLEQGETESAFRMMAVGINLEPDNIPFQSYMTTMLDCTRYRGDIKLLKVVLQAAPGFVPAQNRLARLNEGKRGYKNSLHLYQAWRASGTHQAKSDTRLGEELLAQQYNSTAVQHSAIHHLTVSKSYYALRRMALAYEQLESNIQFTELAQVDRRWGE